ncbi:MAG: hypothetical protein QM756_10690 [Polyangiaceae bacterium]
MLATNGSPSVKHPYDARAYKGIRFWAKAASSIQVRVRLPLRDTTANALGTKCSGSNCEDHYLKVQVIGTSWGVYELAWPDGTSNNGFAQGNWGLQTTFDAATLIGVQFLVNAGVPSADIWIDDVSFIPK